MYSWYVQKWKLRLLNGLLSHVLNCSSILSSVDSSNIKSIRVISCFGVLLVWFVGNAYLDFISFIAMEGFCSESCIFHSRNSAKWYMAFCARKRKPRGSSFTGSKTRSFDTFKSLVEPKWLIESQSLWPSTDFSPASDLNLEERYDCSCLSTFILGIVKQIFQSYKITAYYCDVLQIYLVFTSSASVLPF